jgi:hypothetical protein
VGAITAHAIAPPAVKPKSKPMVLITFVLCIVAFVLWGTNGASTLFDMIVAFCT